MWVLVGGLLGAGTPLSTLMLRYPGNGSQQHVTSLRAHLGRFGLGGGVFPDQRIHTLSGGQKCRVCLAAALYRQPHLLILDEPTNHLDLETTDALVDAIRSFNGGVLVVSHDQHLLSTACDELYAVHKVCQKRHTAALGTGLVCVFELRAFRGLSVAARGLFTPALCLARLDQSQGTVERFLGTFQAYKKDVVAGKR